MKKFSNNIVFPAFAALLLVLGCQRDDLCPAATNTTPKLIIRFYDVENRTDPKRPLNMNVGINTQDSLYFERINLDSIAIPLRTNSNTTQYQFTINSPEIVDGEPQEQEREPNTDVFTFSYTRDEQYVNRACSFKVNFLNIKVTRQTLDGSSNWISSATVVQPDVINEENAHINFYY